MSIIRTNIENTRTITAKVAAVSSTDNAVVRFNGTGGAVQNSGIGITDDNKLQFADCTTHNTGGYTGFFTAPFSETGNLPATYYVSTGSFLDSELDHLCNEVSYKRIIRFGDAQAVFESMGLKMVTEE